MKINKILIVLLFPLITEVVISCCNCLVPLIRYYTNKTVKIQNIDNSGSEPMITTANTVHKEAFGIRAQLNREKTACLSPFKSLFIQTAYANGCRCPPSNQFLARDSITAIQVFTLNDFDIMHASNSDISDYFKIFQSFSLSTITDYIKKYDKVLYTDNELELKFDLLLMTPPTINKNHKFKIKITLSDGRILEGESTPIELI